MRLALQIRSFLGICCLYQLDSIVSAQRNSPEVLVYNQNITTTITRLDWGPRKGKIVGGIETERNEYPFIVSLYRNSQLSGHFCGGSIIDKHWVLTAAHCVIKADFKLTAGEHDLRKSDGTEQIVSAVKVIQHPNYNTQTFENDIALVKVSPPFNYTNVIKNFQLPSVHFIAAGNVTTAGWGVLAEGSSAVSPVLRKVTVGVFPNLECAKTYGKEFHMDKMICAGEPEGGKDACQGDSGGPLMCDDARFGETLCGIVSYGYGCARSEFAGVYTKVAYYTDWVTWEQGKDENPNLPDPKLTTVKVIAVRPSRWTKSTKAETTTITTTTKNRRPWRKPKKSASTKISINFLHWSVVLTCSILLTKG